MKTNMITNALLGILCTIALTLSGWALNTTVNCVTEIKVLHEKVDQIAKNKDQDNAQDITLKRHWQLLGWSRDEINTLRQKNKMCVSRWPTS